MTDTNPASQRSEPRERSSDGRHAGAALDSVVWFSLDGTSYGLDVAVVREVVSIDRLLPVPRTPAAIIGAFALRGATVALVDTRILFGLDAMTTATTTATTALVVARGHRTLCGLTIDRVIDVARFVDAQFIPAVRGRDPPQIAGFMSDEQGGLLTVLDTSTIMHSLECLRF
jgi:chemotaxis signal transduction protein